MLVNYTVIVSAVYFWPDAIFMLHYTVSVTAYIESHTVYADGFALGVCTQRRGQNSSNT